MTLVFRESTGIFLLVHKHFVDLKGIYRLKGIWKQKHAVAFRWLMSVFVLSY